MTGMPHKRHKRDRVLVEFRRTGRVDLACAAAGVSRDSHYDWLRTDPDYAAKFDQAREQVAQLLEDEATRRAYQGTMKPMNVGGKLVMIHEFSDTLLIFLLKKRNPAVFGDRVGIEHSGEIGVKRLIGVGLEEL